MRRLANLALLPLVALASAQPPMHTGRPDFDAHRLHPGSFLYRDRVAGKDDGQTEIRVRRLTHPDRYVFSNVSHGPSSQHWRAAASMKFEPLSAELTFGEGNTARQAFQLKYEGEHVAGSASSKGADGRLADRPVDAVVTADTVDQRIDWAATMAVGAYKAGQQFFFHVYDPGTGNSAVIATVLGAENIQVEAGSFHTIHIVYVIDKLGAREKYEVYISEQMPRYLVKEIFPDGTTSELLKMKPSL